MQRILLILKEFTASPFISLAVFLAIAVAGAGSAASLYVLENADRYIESKFSASIPPNVIQIKPKAAPAIGLFRFSLRKPKGTILDDKIIQAIRNYPGVQSVYALEASQIPMQGLIAIFGLQYRTDLICIGAPYDYIAQDLKDPSIRKIWKNWKPGMELPALVPEILFDAYNSSMADPNGLPRITRDMAMGRQLQILFGKSSIKTLDGFAVENATVTGFTAKIANICLVIPISAMDYYNRKYLGKHSSGYMSATVSVKSHEALLDVSKRIQEFGLIQETGKTLSREILELRKTIHLAGSALAMILILLAVSAVGFSAAIAVSNRQSYFELLRVLGASRLFIAFTILLKFVLIGFLAVSASLLLLETMIPRIIHTISIPGFSLNIRIGSDLYRKILLTGSILPALCAVPAIVRIWSSRLNQD